MSDVSNGRHRGEAGRRHGLLRFLGFGILTLTLGLGLFSAYTYRHLNENLTNLNIDRQLGADRPKRVTPKGDGEPLNILVMGSDTRDGEGNDAVGGEKDDGERSDTTILMHISGDRSFAYGTSLPRDAMVERPTCYDEELNEIPGGFAMWNEAFNLGGPACTIRQVEQLTDIHIDHFIVVDFHGFKGMVDALDGVKVCVPEDVNDTHGNIDLKAGTRTVRGDEALDYVRVRTAISNNGDIGRMKRQQAFIAAMASKVMDKEMLARPDRLISFLNAATKSLTLDQDLDSVLKIADLGAQFQDIGLDKLKFVTVPWEVYAPDRNRVVWTEEAEDLWELIRADQPLSRRLGAEAIDASVGPGKKAPTDSGSSASPDASDETSADSSDEAMGGMLMLAPDPEELARQNGLC